MATISRRPLARSRDYCHREIGVSPSAVSGERYGRGASASLTVRSVSTRSVVCDDGWDALVYVISPCGRCRGVPAQLVRAQIVSVDRTVVRARVFALLVCFVCPTHPPGVGLVRLCKSVCVVTGRLARRECDQESPFAINVFCVTDGDTQDQWRLSHDNNPTSHPPHHLLLEKRLVANRNSVRLLYPVSINDAK